MWGWLLVLGLAQPAAGPVDQVLAALAAADEARVAHAREAAAWDLERERLAALVRGLEQETRQLRAEAARLAPPAAAPRLAPQEAERLDRVVAAAQAHLEARLIMPELPERTTESDGELRRWAAALAAQEADLAALEVGVRTGLLEGAPRAVHVLRIGPAHWWCALDAIEGGPARPTAQGLVLERAEVADAQAITDAVAMALGQRAPVLVELPVGHLGSP